MAGFVQSNAAFAPASLRPLRRVDIRLARGDKDAANTAATGKSRLMLLRRFEPTEESEVVGVSLEGV